jgi:hypothetical protein
MPPWFTQSWMRIRTSCRNLSSSIPISIVASTGLNRYIGMEVPAKGNPKLSTVLHDHLVLPGPLDSHANLVVD